EAYSRGGWGNGKYRLTAVLNIPVINPAKRNGMKKSTNLTEYRPNDWLRISPMDSSCVGFFMHKDIVHHTQFSL
ncbi:MAG: hypothetical protein QW231_05395, partial [Candidatus Bathyarchaeia archaeon]